MKIKSALILFTAIAAVSFVSCSKKCKKPSGKSTTQNRVVKEFTEIEVGGNLNVLLVQDDSHRVEVTGDENFMESIKTEVSGGTLSIKEEDCEGEKISVVIHTRDIKLMKFGGVIDVHNEQPIKTGDLHMEFAGGVKADLKLNAAKLTTRAAGRVEIKLEGQASQHDIDMAGSGTLDALNFVVAKYNINAAGVANCKINVLEELNVNTSGSGDIEYKGSPAKINKKIMGAGGLKQIP
ncbi:MAG: DUF2807 domain-containing protein [Mucilaginibacter polytrichastri]|nr:DUF2807 domain-containing protein [Mucilaginibacter polytrichastri]